MSQDKKADGPKHLDKLSKPEDAPKIPKIDFTAFHPPGAPGVPVDGSQNKTAPIHAAQAAAAKTEDRLKQEEEGEVPDGEEVDEDEPFDQAAFDAVARNLGAQYKIREQLDTEEQRELIEKRLKESGNEIDLSQMYEIQEFRQTVPIIPGKFEPEFRSITPAEDHQLKLMMSKEDPEVSLRYLTDKYAVLTTVCALRKINQTMLPEHFTNQKGWNDKMFNEKAKIILRMPVPAVWSLMIHSSWFEARCRKVFKLEDLKNG